MKPFPILLFALAAGNATALAQTRQQTLEVTVENNWTSAKEDEPVVIRLADVNPGFEVQSATVFCDAYTIPAADACPKISSKAMTIADFLKIPKTICLLPLFFCFFIVFSIPCLRRLGHWSFIFFGSSAIFCSVSD